MFRITAQTCRAFTWAEVLIMAAMNMEDARLASEATSDQLLSLLDAERSSALLTVP